jgi:phosphate transporter
VEQFRFALDKEREKVTAFYKSKEAELHGSLDALIDEVSVLEARDLGTDDVIKEEDEDDGDVDDEEGHASEGEGLLSPRIPPNQQHVRPKYRPRTSILGRLGAFGRRRKAPTSDGADILEAAFAPSLARRRSSSQNRMQASVSTLGATQEEGPSSPSTKSQPPGIRRQISIEGDAPGGGHDRRTSVSSASSHEPDIWSTRRRHLSLGLVEMEEEDVPHFVFSHSHHEDENGGQDDPEHGVPARDGPVFVWTANNDYATVVRIGFKKRIAALWLEAYALKQYVDLNLTAFEKILKKFDKNTGNKVRISVWSGDTRMGSRLME